MQGLLVAVGESTDRRDYRLQTVLAGGGEVFQEVEGGEGIGIVGEDLGGSGVAEGVAEKGDEALHERAVGVAAEVAAAVTEFADEPDLRDAAGNAVDVGALCSG